MAFNINGVGTTFYGRSDKQADGSYIATEWVVLVYLPIIPIRSFRMRPVSGGTYLVVYASQKYVAESVPLHWKQIRNMYLTMIGGVVAAASIVVAVGGLPF